MIQSTATAQPALHQSSNAGRLRRAALVALGFGIFFLLLRTQQFLEVDGALRSLMIFRDPSNRLHGNNHMLYPFWIWVWTRAATLAGWGAQDWLEFVRQCQALNATCFAAGIGMLFTVLEAIAGTRWALLGSLQFGLSTAALLHATNSAEPVTGLFFSLTALAVLLPALRRETRAGLFLVGVLLALAMASYQAMVLVAPIVAFACICWPGTHWRTAVTRLLATGAGGLVAIVTTYGLAYSRMGIAPKKMLGRFLTLDGGQQTYGGFSASKVVNVPFGMIRNLFHGVPSNYSGTRSLLRDPHAALWILAALAGLAFLTASAAMIGWGIVSGVQRLGVGNPLVWFGILFSLALVIFPAFYWGPTYDKLWLQPLAVFAIAAAWAYKFGGYSAAQRKTLTAGLILLVVVEAAVNIPNTIRSHVRPTPHMEEARDFSEMVKPGDAVVLDFDDISMLWLAVWGYGKNTIVLPASSRPEAGEWLTNAEKNSTGKDSSLFIVGILDEDRTQWNAFLGRATGISYADFNCYRQKSTTVRSYPYGAGSVTVRQRKPLRACEGLAETEIH